jgi:hypothetical protein
VRYFFGQIGPTQPYICVCVCVCIQRHRNKKHVSKQIHYTNPMLKRSMIYEIFVRVPITRQYVRYVKLRRGLGLEVPTIFFDLKIIKACVSTSISITTPGVS